MSSNITKTANQVHINNSIYEIINDYLIYDYRSTINFDDWYDFKTNEELYEYMEKVRNDVFNSEEDNLLAINGKDYTLDFTTTISIIKFLKEKIADDLDNEETFLELFNYYEDNDETESKIINQYCYWFIDQEGFCDLKIYKILENIAKYNHHKAKHNNLINLYEKLNKKNKTKPKLKIIN